MHINTRTSRRPGLWVFSCLFFLLGMAPAAFADNFCRHGEGAIDEDDGYWTYATIRLNADFDGDGLIDKFCKDVRRHDSNGNRLLEWLVLGNGQVPFSAQWNEWCTHRNSRVSVERRGNKSILVCTDNHRGYWEREIP